VAPASRDPGPAPPRKRVAEAQTGQCARAQSIGESSGACGSLAGPVRALRVSACWARAGRTLRDLLCGRRLALNDVHARDLGRPPRPRLARNAARHHLRGPRGRERACARPCAAGSAKALPCTSLAHQRQRMPATPGAGTSGLPPPAGSLARASLAQTLLLPCTPPPWPTKRSDARAPRTRQQLAAACRLARAYMSGPSPNPTMHANASKRGGARAPQTMTTMYMDSSPPPARPRAHACLALNWTLPCMPAPAFRRAPQTRRPCTWTARRRPRAARPPRAAPWSPRPRPAPRRPGPAAPRRPAAAARRPAPAGPPTERASRRLAS